MMTPLGPQGQLLNSLSPQGAGGRGGGRGGGRVEESEPDSEGGGSGEILRRSEDP